MFLNSLIFVISFLRGNGIKDSKLFEVQKDPFRNQEFQGGEIDSAVHKVIISEPGGSDLEFRLSALM